MNSYLGRRIVASQCAETFGNPYLKLLYQALSGHGYRYEGRFDCTVDWLRRNGNCFDILHFHWPEFVWEANPLWLRRLNRRRGFPLVGGASDFFRHLLKGHEFRRFLRHARRRGKKVVWTVHNVVPHERLTAECLAALDFLSKNSDLVVVHDDSAMEKLKATRMLECPVVISRHGNYDGVFPDSRKENCVDKLFNLADLPRPICGILGSIRPYKGVSTALNAAVNSNSALSIIIAGDVHGDVDKAEMLALDDRHGNIRIIPRRITDQEYADLAAKCDYLLFPYKSITGSGALAAAMTFKKPYVASDLDYFRGVNQIEPRSGALFPVGDVEGLQRAVQRMEQIGRVASGEALKRLNAEFKWSECVIPLVRCLEDLS